MRVFVSCCAAQSTPPPSNTTTLFTLKKKFPATEYHLGLLKAKLAKYRSQLLEPAKKGEKGEGFDVLKSGDARVALIGFPSVGKVSGQLQFNINRLDFCYH